MKLREPRCDSEYDRLAQRMAKLEEKLFGVTERNAQLEEENSRLHEQVARRAQCSPFCLFRISLTDRYPTAVPGSGGKSQRNRQNGNSSINIVAQKVHYKYSFNVVEPLLVAAQMLVDFGAFIDEVDDSGNTQLEFYEKESAADKVGRFASYFFI